MTQVEALDILKTGANVFLTGEPGAGKTHTVNAYVKYLRECGIEPAITASTGIAATHIGGMTIHSWSGIGIKSALTNRDIDRISQNEYIGKRISRAHVLIIDEVSMLSPDTLSSVEAVCRAVRGKGGAFGGLQVVLVGDFFQLPPIVSRSFDENGEMVLFEDEETPRFAYHSSAWQRAEPLYCYLTEQHRQDDPEYLAILSAIRKNQFCEDHINHLTKRSVSKEMLPKNAPKLYSHNRNVDSMNEMMLAEVSGTPKVFEMETEGHERVVVTMKKSCLSPESLTLKVGASVMFTKNNPRAGFVNGTLGKVSGFEKVSGNPIVQIRDGRHIVATPMEWTLEENGKVHARLTQVPLRLAWAITVHKSQGMSLDEAVMDLSDVFEYGQGYVALSRVRRLNGLHLLGWNAKAFQVHPDVLTKDAIFRQSSEDACDTFEKMDLARRDAMHANFIKACDGKIPKSPKVQKLTKRHTVDVTHDLILEKIPLLDIVKRRGLTEGTIMSHIEHLIRQKRISPATDLLHLRPEPKRLSAALNVFKQIRDKDNEDSQGQVFLSPARSLLGPSYSFNELRLIRLFLE
ncbi:MAG: AAA family ATPase [Candidatus Vogelbacteria bacterium CG10_big_fil_rev_8_21_14_0_10_45_14]|uniref:AAA family ATPase n=1 Tax=Candidatus Vogelbacteria bacterium CG10_big_fil_rev_8_21_14_0_10_45_14 TaxID=1975042 RepID=A0A2H0RKR7_9BACT|nr:MAG: AAA family ATPase [Candidatus Vogelbacteria bacterium CG10_big_fil_rev_8_21_14_0_10_45_14]